MKDELLLLKPCWASLEQDAKVSGKENLTGHGWKLKAAHVMRENNAQSIVGIDLYNIEGIYWRHCLKMQPASSGIPYHPGHAHISLLLSGNCKVKVLEQLLPKNYQAVEYYELQLNFELH